MDDAEFLPAVARVKAIYDEYMSMDLDTDEEIKRQKELLDLLEAIDGYIEPEGKGIEARDLVEELYLLIREWDVYGYWFKEMDEITSKVPVLLESLHDYWKERHPSGGSAGKTSEEEASINDETVGEPGKDGDETGGGSPVVPRLGHVKIKPAPILAKPAPGLQAKPGKGDATGPSGQGEEMGSKDDEVPGVARPVEKPVPLKELIHEKKLKIEIKPVKILAKPVGKAPGSTDADIGETRDEKQIEPGEPGSHEPGGSKAVEPGTREGSSPAGDLPLKESPGPKVVSPATAGEPDATPRTVAPPSRLKPVTLKPIKLKPIDSKPVPGTASTPAPTGQPVDAAKGGEAETSVDFAVESVYEMVKSRLGDTGQPQAPAASTPEPVVPTIPTTRKARNEPVTPGAAGAGSLKIPRPVKISVPDITGIDLESEIAPPMEVSVEDEPKQSIPKPAPVEMEVNAAFVGEDASSSAVIDDDGSKPLIIIGEGEQAKTAHGQGRARRKPEVQVMDPPSWTGGDESTGGMLEDEAQVIQDEIAGEASSLQEPGDFAGVNASTAAPLLTDVLISQKPSGKTLDEKKKVAETLLSTFGTLEPPVSTREKAREKGKEKDKEKDKKKDKSTAVPESLVEGGAAVQNVDGFDAPGHVLQSQAGAESPSPGTGPARPLPQASHQDESGPAPTGPSSTFPLLGSTGVPATPAPRTEDKKQVAERLASTFGTLEPPLPGAGKKKPAKEGKDGEKGVVPGPASPAPSFGSPATLEGSRVGGPPSEHQQQGEPSSQENIAASSIDLFTGALVSRAKEKPAGTTKPSAVALFGVQTTGGASAQPREPATPSMPIGADVDIDTLPETRDGLFQSLIALEGKRYSLERAKKDLRGKLDQGSITEQEYQRRLLQFKEELDNIAAKIKLFREKVKAIKD